MTSVLNFNGSLETPSEMGRIKGTVPIKSMNSIGPNTCEKNRSLGYPRCATTSGAFFSP